MYYKPAKMSTNSFVIAAASAVGLYYIVKVISDLVAMKVRHAYSVYFDRKTAVIVRSVDCDHIYRLHPDEARSVVEYIECLVDSNRNLNNEPIGTHPLVNTRADRPCADTSAEDADASAEDEFDRSAFSDAMNEFRNLHEFEKKESEAPETSSEEEPSEQVDTLPRN